MKKVKDLWEKYRGQKKALVLPNTSSSTIARPPQQRPREIDFDPFEEIAQELDEYTRPASQDEYEDFISGQPEDIGNMPALMWWCEEKQRKRWPRLSLMALDIFVNSSYEWWARASVFRSSSYVIVGKGTNGTWNAWDDRVLKALEKEWYFVEAFREWRIVELSLFVVRLKRKVFPRSTIHRSATVLLGSSPSDPDQHVDGRDVDIQLGTTLILLQHSTCKQVLQVTLQGGGLSYNKGNSYLFD